jgi:drug/metabolite transporter (DMT)-like permease
MRERMGRESRGVGLSSLLITTVLWGTSFPAIKIATSWVDGITYTWVRGAISVAGLLPVVIYISLRRGLGLSSAKGGIITGVIFALALWFQGWGTSLTTASNSAFITGLNVVIVHAIDALVKKEEYGVKGFSSLILSVAGLYLISGGVGKINPGDLLVLISAFFAAIQVELIHRYSASNPAIFTFFELLPMIGFFIVDAYRGVTVEALMKALPALTYLGLVCSDVALAFQVYGQRSFRAYEAAVIYLLEPVTAALFSYVVLGEVLSLEGYIGAALIITAMAVVSVPERRR